MRYILAALMLGTLAGGSMAEDATCTSQATAKKLAGAALTSFMKKCEQDAAAACDADSKAKKLAGAALDAHMKKCISDKTGAEAKAGAAPAAAKPADAAKPAPDKK